NCNGDTEQMSRLMGWIDAIAAEMDVTSATGDTLELLSSLESSLPHQTTELRRRATDITRRLYERIKAALDSGADAARPECARLANNLASRLSWLGRREEALAP